MNEELSRNGNQRNIEKDAEDVLRKPVNVWATWDQLYMLIAWNESWLHQALLAFAWIIVRPHT